MIAWFEAIQQHLLQATLARDQQGPLYRIAGVGVAMTIIWCLAAVVERPVPDPELVALWQILYDPLEYLLYLPFLNAFYALLHPSVLRHLVLPLTVLFWGMYSGASYLNNLFELKGTGATLYYLLSSIFGLGYDEIEIKDGHLTPESTKKRVHAIGGPGLLKVHLGNAALFERPNGSSATYSARRRQFLQGFERLREEVIDLRDQIRNLGDMKVYTKDGVPVQAIQAEVVFRVRGNQPRSKDVPYPYDETAVRRLIYGQRVGPGHAAKPWTDTLADLAREEIAHYVGQHQLKELIAQKQKGMLPPPPTAVQDTSRASSSPPLSRAEATANARQPLTMSFYSEKFARRCEKLGVELIWIGVGTLETPAEISQELIDAWYAEYEAVTKAGISSLQDETRKVRNSVILNLLRSLKDFWIERTRTPDLQETTPVEEWPTPYDTVRLFSILLRELRQGTTAPLETDVDRAVTYLGRLAEPVIIGTENESQATG